MAVNNLRVLKKVRKNYTWSGMITSLVVTSLVAAIIAILFTAGVQYALESWLSSEYDKTRYVAGNMEKAGDYGADGLDLNDREYVVLDTDGNKVYEYGQITCCMTQIEVEVPSFDRARTIVVYPDDENHIINIIRNNLFIEVEDLLKYLFKDGAAVNFRGEGYVCLPIWVSAPLGNDGYSLVLKTGINISRTDILLLIVLLSVLALLIVFLMFVFIFKLCSGISNQRRLKILFFRDEVTGGNNWTYFRVKGEQLLKKNRNSRIRFAVLDVVFVKYRNYCVTHSVEEGEKKLEMIRDILDKFVEKDEISAHYASANFVALLKVNDEEVLKKRLTDLISRLEQIDNVHKLGFHIGVDFIEPARDRNGNVIKRREVELEKSYNNACAARATLDDSDDSAFAFLDEKMVEEQKWIDAVHERQAAALANEEFVVYYQPKYNPSTGKLTGAEALIRWQSPEFGFVPPGRIIPIFEKNGFITEIDHYMIRHVARNQKAWYDRGINCVPVSVNVSRAHFVEDDLAEQIRDIVDDEGAPHELIELELTESAFFDDKKALIATISRLKSYGFAVSMDDFGSGYSSLNSLKDLPLDVLKLDAEFFRGNTEGDRGEIVISETIKLARALNMRTVAEGVEIKEQVDFLADQGCDMIQGYYFAKPMPCADYEEKLIKGVAD